MKKLTVLFLLSILLMGCQKVRPLGTTWVNQRNENVVVVCDGTFFNINAGTETKKDDWSVELWGYDFKVYLQNDYLKENPIQTGTAKTYNVIDYPNK